MEYWLNRTQLHHTNLKSCIEGYSAVPRIINKISQSSYRIVFSARDLKNRSVPYTGILNFIGSGKWEFEIDDLNSPIIPLGSAGSFDDSGVMPTWILKKNHEFYMYYIGWNLGVTVPFRNSIGVAKSSDGKTFEKMFEGPILDRTKNEPHFCASACIYPSQHNYYLYYLSCTGWEKQPDNSMRHNYHIKFATSKDGINWDRNSHIAINYKDENEFAISCPSVIEINGKWHMWFSARGQLYKIYHATSEDGISWSRDDQYGLQASMSDWENKAVCYPQVFKHDDKIYMLYNGNDYGRTGFGICEFNSDTYKI